MLISTDNRKRNRWRSSAWLAAVPPALVILGVGGVFAVFAASQPSVGADSTALAPVSMGTWGGLSAPPRRPAHGEAASPAPRRGGWSADRSAAPALGASGDDFQRRVPRRRTHERGDEPRSGRDHHIHDPDHAHLLE